MVKQNIKNMLRLQVMMSIQHPEEYYQQAAQINGLVICSMTHAEVSVWKATLKAIEADALIWAADNIQITNSEKDAIEFQEKLKK